MGAQGRVVIINTSPDFVDILRGTLEEAGFQVVGVALARSMREGTLTFEQFVRDSKPEVVVFDIAPPYAANWAVFQQARASPAATGLRFVLTSTNARSVRELLGAESIEIVGKPADLDDFLGAVQRALDGK